MAKRLGLELDLHRPLGDTVLERRSSGRERRPRRALGATHALELELVLAPADPIERTPELIAQFRMT